MRPIFKQSSAQHAELSHIYSPKCWNVEHHAHNHLLPNNTCSSCSIHQHLRIHRGESDNWAQYLGYSNNRGPRKLFGFSGPFLWKLKPNQLEKLSRRCPDPAFGRRNLLGGGGSLRSPLPSSSHSLRSFDHSSSFTYSTVLAPPHFVSELLQHWRSLSPTFPSSPLPPRTKFSVRGSSSLDVSCWYCHWVTSNEVRCCEGSWKELR